MLNDFYECKKVIVRSHSSGVHYGVVEKYDANTRHVKMKNVRRIWFWEGAFTLSAVSQNGIKNGKLSMIIPELIITQVEEIIPCSEKAIECLDKFPIHNPG